MDGFDSDDEYAADTMEAEEEEEETVQDLAFDTFVLEACSEQDQSLEEVLDAKYLESLRPKSLLDFASRFDSFTFVLLDIVLKSNYQKTKTDAFLFGRRDDGSDICAIVEGWSPYFYMEPPEGWSSVFEGDSCLFCSKLMVLLEEALQDKMAERKAGREVKSRQQKGSFVKSLEMVKRKSIYGYSPDGLKDFVRVEVMDAWCVRLMKEVFEGFKKDAAWTEGHVIDMCKDSGDLRLESRRCGASLYDAEVDSLMQFMVNTGLHGCQWCQVKAADDGETFCTISGNDKRSTCATEIRLHVKCLKPLSMDSFNDLGRLRILSFDIEAAGRRGVFPEASVDPVIQIAVTFKVLAGEDEGHKKPLLLSYKSCDPIEGVDVFCFEDERMLLKAFSAVVNSFDADIFTGYNICNFDFPYLQKRARVLEALKNGIELESDFEGVVDFEKMTRMRDQSMQLRETVFQSVQTGKRKRTRVTVQGRVCLDMLTSIQNNQSYRLERYTLNAVSEYFLGDHKVDLPFTQITPMWEKDSFSRAELGKYCVKDAQLPLDLMAKTDALTQTIEMARCTGIPFDWVLQRGVMIRNTSLLLRCALVRHYVFPNISKKNGPAITKKYEGATVLDAHSGIHNNVGVLDFSAMYPSIIRAHNLCYSTIVLDHSLIVREEATVVPYDSDESRMSLAMALPRRWFCMGKHIYVPDTASKGLIPEVVEFLQNCSNKAKKAYAIETDPIKKKTCKAREMAFKVAGNGMYGSLGSTQGLLPLLAIAETVTAIGRSDIQKVKSAAERMFSDCLVVYGDTDSVFVRFNIQASCTERGAQVVLTVPEAVAKTSELAMQLASSVNTMMKAPKKIEFEKVYSTMLCLSKKRYAGVMYSADHKWGTEPPIDIKGMQCVRRDGCGLTRDLVRDCLMSILHTGSHVDAAAIARKTLNDIFEDRIPLEQYAIRKVLRKSMQDCCLDMKPSEIIEIRSKLLPQGKSAPDCRLSSAEIREAVSRGILKNTSDLEQYCADSLTSSQIQEIRLKLGVSSLPLTYAEQDEAIRRGIKLPWKPRVRLPHILLAWRIRMKDPGIAPVLGESISYIVTNNGGKQIYEKVETLEHVKSMNLGYTVDKKYYLDSLRVPLENIFLPIYMQQIAEKNPSKKSKLDLEAKVELEKGIWFIAKKRSFQMSDVSKSASIHNSPIARAFKRQAP